MDKKEVALIAEATNEKKQLLQNTHFKLIAWYPMVQLILQISAIGISLWYWSIHIFIMFCFIVISLSSGLFYLLVKDRILLQQHSEYAPPLRLYFITSTYMYDRQKINRLSMRYFWLYLINSIFLRTFHMLIIFLVAITTQGFHYKI